MGQRHQAFLIARVVPHGQTKSYYRCVAALHHQWCYGTLPLKAVRRLFCSLKNKDNAEIVREEVRLLNGKFGRWGEAPPLPDIPCPYTAFLLATSWHLDLSDPKKPYTSHCSLEYALLDAGMGSTDGDNNDGITVIDITNPEDPAFCFVSVNGLDAEEVPLMVPLSATSYVRAYYPAPRPNEAAQDGRMSEETIMKILSQLPSDRSVTLEMLAEAWPGDYLTEKDPEDCGFIPLAYSATMIETRKIPSLMELSLKPAIDHALDNDQTEYLQDLDFLSEKAQAIIEVFQSRKKIPDSGIALLATALGQVSDDTIDISHFSLSTDQIVNLISAFPNLKTLKLSHNPAVTVDTIHAVLSSKPKIKRLVALDTCITNESLSTLLSTAAHLFLHLDAFIHCFFFTGKSHFPSAFSFIGSTSTSRSNLYGASLPFFSPALVVQALTDYFCKINYLDRLQGTGMQCQATLSTEVRKPGETWLNRSVPLIAPFSLRALSGEGWFFAYSSPEYNRPASYFAFAQAAEPGGAPSTGGASADPVSGSHFTAKKIVDLKGFLLEMESEGREPAPAAAVEALQKIFQQLGEDSNHNLKLMDEEQLKTFCQNALSAK